MIKHNKCRITITPFVQFFMQMEFVVYAHFSGIGIFACLFLFFSQMPTTQKYLYFGGTEMVDLEKAEKAITMLLEAIGENPSRSGLLETPKRVAKFYDEITKGYSDNPRIHLQKVFVIENTDVVIEKNIEFFSLCEHHLLPFFGKIHIAYIPNGKVVGLSKLARVAETFARRLQIQEQLTDQIANSIETELSPLAVLVMIEAEHTCMTMRGIKKVGSKTVTVSTRGKLKEDLALQKNVLDLIKQ